MLKYRGKQLEKKETTIESEKKRVKIRGYATIRLTCNLSSKLVIFFSDKWYY